MLEKILSYLNNDFRVSDKEPETKTYAIENGTLGLDNVREGQYVRIFGSAFNDGIYRYPLERLVDETFTGCVIPLAIPRVILTLAEEIETWSEKNQPTVFTSESFGGYAYSKATKANGTAAGWREVFADDLKPYKKMKQH